MCCLDTRCARFVLLFIGIIFYVIRYLNDCEFDIFHGLNNMEKEVLNLIEKWEFDFYHYDLCNGPHCPIAYPPQHQIILLVVKIIFGKMCIVNEIN